MTPTSFLRTGAAAAAILGEDTPAARARLIRMIDRREVAAIRIGDRGDRLVPATEPARLAKLAATNLRTAGNGRDEPDPAA